MNKSKIRIFLYKKPFDMMKRQKPYYISMKNVLHLCENSPFYQTVLIK